MKKSTLYLLTASPVHGKEVLLAFTPGSTNAKTGNMAQVYILHPDDSPQEISNKGLDDRVCGECPLRHSKGGACYVTLFHGPRAVYKGWVNASKRLDTEEEVLSMLTGKAVRFGAYGDPVHIPKDLAAGIMKVARGWTAYTHQWRAPVNKFWKGKAMASCDTEAQLKTAEKKGWSGFLAASEAEEVHLCDNEERGTSCEDCLKCDGDQGSVRVSPHGSRKKKHPGLK